MQASDTKKAAKKVFIKDTTGLNTGDLCRVLGTVVSRYETEKYTIVSLDDATATISARAFDGGKRILESLKIGDIADVIGEIREYNEEKYISPRTAYRIENPNWELVRRLEIMLEKAQYAAAKPTAPTAALSSAPTAENEIAEEEVVEDKKYVVLRFIVEFDRGKGVSYETLLKETKLAEKEVDDALNDLISEGEIFEPKISMFKKV